MGLQRRSTTRDFWIGRYKLIVMGAALIVLAGSALCLAGPDTQRAFSSPEEAVRALISGLRGDNSNSLDGIFGPGSKDLLPSGDPAVNKVKYQKFIRLFEEKNRLQKESPNKVMLHVGTHDWPFPIPIVKKNSLWQFDTQEGREEILARKIGKNELSAIEVCLAYVDAQREYALKDRDGDGLLEYAQKLRSDPGKMNGLYWETGEGGAQSPLGPLLAAAQEHGYTFRESSGGATPYHGYYYRILSAQGKNAPGGGYGYVVKGKMLGGFAMVAYPAQYGVSGIMTFVVNHDGIVYQKDLGENTQKEGQRMTLFDPDNTWQKVGESLTKAAK